MSEATRGLFPQICSSGLSPQAAWHSPRRSEHNTHNFPSHRVSTKCFWCKIKNLAIILDSSWQIVPDNSHHIFCSHPDVSYLRLSPGLLGSVLGTICSPPHACFPAHPGQQTGGARKPHSSASAWKPPIMSSLLQSNGFQGPLPPNPHYTSHLLPYSSTHSLALTGLCPGFHSLLQQSFPLCKHNKWLTMGKCIINVSLSLKNKMPSSTLIKFQHTVIWWSHKIKVQGKVFRASVDFSLLQQVHSILFPKELRKNLTVLSISTALSARIALPQTREDLLSHLLLVTLRRLRLGEALLTIPSETTAPAVSLLPVPFWLLDAIGDTLLAHLTQRENLGGEELYFLM